MGVKEWYKSTTVWLNIIGGLLVFFNTLPGMGVPIPQTVLAGVVIVLNLVNRCRTNTGITFKSQ